MKRQIITASAFIHKDNKVLLVKRVETETFAPNHWELPGGHIEFGEGLEVGLKREVMEETGLDVTTENTFHQFTYTFPEEEKQYVEVILFAKTLNSSQDVKLNAYEHSEYLWVTKEEFIDKNLDMFEPEKVAILKGFKQLNAHN